MTALAVAAAAIGTAYLLLRAACATYADRYIHEAKIDGLEG